MLNHVDVRAEMRFLSVFQSSLSSFRSTIVHRADETREKEGKPRMEPSERKLLQGEGTLRIAEFFLVVQRVIGADPEQIRAFLNRHNSDMKSLAETCANGFTKGGIAKQRIERSILSQKTIDYIAHEVSSGELRFEQSVLQKIFVRAMSFESCRQLLVVLADGGLIRRRSYRSVLYSPCGVLEDIYLEHLTRVSQCRSD